MVPLALPRLIAAAALAAAALPAQAHHAADPLSWPWEPWALACIAVSSALYARGVARLWRKAGVGRGVSSGQALRFALGTFVLALALLSPIDTLGAALFSAHMVQHELLMVVAAPLLVVGRPLEAWTWGLPPAWRGALGAVARAPGLRRCWAAIAEPLGAWTLHALALWLWHIPALFEAALASEALHVAQHASFLGTALLFWGSVFDRSPRNAGGSAMASLFATLGHSGALGALLTFSARPWYPAYAAGNTFGLAPLADQQLGGLIMWGPASLAYLVAALVIASRWLSPPRRRTAGSSAGTSPPSC
jgi:putative membrane protein